VKDFKEPIFQQDMIDKLVMDANRIKTLKALAGSYIRQNIHGEKTEVAPWSADFIQGKGQGQIILLHGKPGVGKTCTAGELWRETDAYTTLTSITRMHCRVYETTFDGSDK
jgi:hypothetical protein